MHPLRNSRGQSLIEYVILVALVGVASIGLVRHLQKQINVNLANVIHGLKGDRVRAQAESLREDDLRKKDFSDFMNGAASGGAH